MTINVMVNGAPGNVARMVITHVIRDRRFALVPYSLTGPEITEEDCTIDDTTVRLVRPDARDTILEAVRKQDQNVICIDFTHPSAVNGNADFYCAGGLPFVHGHDRGRPGKAYGERDGIRYFRGHCTEHGQADRRFSGDDGLCR